MTATECWHCCLMTTETLPLSDNKSKLKCLKIILAIRVSQKADLKVSHHEMTHCSADFQSFRYYPQEWSLLPINNSDPTLHLPAITWARHVVLDRDVWLLHSIALLYRNSFMYAHRNNSMCTQVTVSSTPIQDTKVKKICLSPQKENVWFLSFFCPQT